jgi:hypothetical protein
MRPPFPGMDPYLEHPALWPDVHNSLIAAIRDAIAPLVAPRYYVGLERRAYQLKPDDLALIGIADVAVITPRATEFVGPLAPAGVAMPEVEVPMIDEVGENFLEVHEVGSGTLVTVLELLSPVNKLHGQGRQDYERKRDQVFRSRTNLVEVDLLRAGEPMPVMRRRVRSDYRILVSRGAQRPRAVVRLRPAAADPGVPPAAVAGRCRASGRPGGHPRCPLRPGPLRPAARLHAASGPTPVRRGRRLGAPAPSRSLAAGPLTPGEAIRRRGARAPSTRGPSAGARR